MIETTDFTTPWGTTITASFRQDKNDYNTLVSCLEQDEYEISRLDQHTPNKVAVDIGAHIGGVTLAFADLGYETFSVEMLPENVELIKENVRQNLLSAPVHILPFAVTQYTQKQVEAYYSDTSNEAGEVHEFIGSTRTDRGAHEFLGKGKMVKVKGTTLDQIFTLHKIERCDIMKIDIEGAEWDIVRSSKIAIPRTAIIVAEIETEDGKEITTEDYRKILGDDWEDWSEKIYPRWSKPGKQLHGCFVNKALYGEK